MAEKFTPAQELEQLQLERTRFEIRDLRNAEDMRKVRARAIERSIRTDTERQEAQQSQCLHKKGGKGVEMMYRGSDSLYAVIKHQLPHGPIIVVCQRCIRLWAPPDPALNAKGASVESKRLYARLLTEYRDALNYPTDNEMSGSQLFVITRNEPLAEAS